jgi:hypothetical protein
MRSKLGQTAVPSRVERCAVEALTWDKADRLEALERRRVSGRGRVPLHEVRQQGEIFARREAIDLVAHRRLHVDRGIDLAGRRGVFLAPCAERLKLELILQSVHRGVALRRAGAVDAPEKPDDGGRRLEFGHAVRNGAGPARPGDDEGLRLRPRGAASGDGENVGPAVKKRQQEIAALHVGDAEHPRLVADIKEHARVERVGVRGGDIAKAGVRIGPELDELSHGAARALDLGDVRHHASRHFHRDERIAIDIRVGGDFEILGALNEIRERTVNREGAAG